jgi:hypothetical protein
MLTWSLLEWLEALSYLVTIVGLPFAIGVFLFEQKDERASEEEGIYQSLSDEYASFLRLVLEHADLHLRSKPRTDNLTAEQEERRLLLFDLLISLFERAYLLVYEDDMTRKQARMWQSWEDYMHFWCLREDFRALLPEMLEGEDPDFSRHLLVIAASEAKSAQPQ